MEKKNLIVPTHVGIIVDGNGRWAQARGLSRSEGHRAGFNRLKEICIYAGDLGVKYLSLYVFSTENFKRAKPEVDFLMNLFVKMFHKEFKEVMDRNFKIVFSGRRDPLPKKVLDEMDQITEESKNNTGTVLNFCLNYGGQTEMLDMTKKICQEVIDGKLNVDDISLDTLQHHLYQDLPPLDFVIRTSGELRLSNFMLYQASYAEFYFPKIYFPDFTEHDFDDAIVEYNNRNRRFGGNAS